MPQLNSIVVPDGVVEADVRRALLNEFDLEIGAGLGALAGKVWRVGLMGQSACRRNVLFFLPRWKRSWVAAEPLRRRAQR